MWSASNAYSTHVPESRTRSRRSRTVSLPSECWRSTRSGPPISRARSRRAFRSPTSGPQSWTSPPPVVVTASSSHGEHVPLAGDALERMAPAVREIDARAGNQIAHGARDEHLARPGERRDARADVHGNTGQVGVRDEPGHEDEVELAVADDLVRDRRLAALRVANLRLLDRHYLPFHFGSRFSANAATPSAVSSDALVTVSMAWRYARASSGSMSSTR